jgi:hypothetical protein
VKAGALVYYLPAHAVTIQDYVLFNEQAIIALEEQ